MALEFHQKLIMFLFNFLKAFKSHCVQTLTGLRLGGTLEWQHEKLHAHGQTASPQFTHTHTHTHPRKHSVLCPSFCPPPLHYFIHPPVSHEEHLLQGCGASAHKKKRKKNCLPWWWKNRHQKKQERRNVVGKSVKLKSEHFSLALSSWSRHRTSLDARVFHHLAAWLCSSVLPPGWRQTKHRSLSTQPARNKDRERWRQRESEKKRSFMQKTTTGVIHGHAWGPCLFYSASPSISSVCFIFRCTLAPEVKYLSLYNLQQWIAPSDGDVKSKVGEGAVC